MIMPIFGISEDLVVMKKRARMFILNYVIVRPTYIGMTVVVGSIAPTTNPSSPFPSILTIM